MSPTKKKVYKVSPMKVHRRMLVHEYLNIRGTSVYYEKWLFRPDEFPCGQCKDTSNVVFMRLAPLNAVCRSCKHCGVTERIFPRNPKTDAVQAVQLEESRLITEEELRAFIERNQMKKRFLHPIIFAIIDKKAKKTVKLEDLKDLELE